MQCGQQPKRAHRLRIGHGETIQRRGGCGYADVLGGNQSRRQCENWYALWSATKEGKSLKNTMQKPYKGMGTGMQM